MQKDTKEDALRDRGEQVLERTVSPQGGKEGRIPGGPTRQGAAVKPERVPDNDGGVRGESDPDFR